MPWGGGGAHTSEARGLDSAFGNSGANCCAAQFSHNHVRPRQGGTGTGSTVGLKCSERLRPASLPDALTHSTPLPFWQHRAPARKNLSRDESLVQYCAACAPPWPRKAKQRKTRKKF